MAGVEEESRGGTGSGWGWGAGLSLGGVGENSDLYLESKTRSPLTEVLPTEGKGPATRGQPGGPGVGFLTKTRNQGRSHSHITSPLPNINTESSPPSTSISETVFILKCSGSHP